MKTTINKALIILLSGLFLIAASVYADELGIDYPHCSTYDIGCSSCHYMFDGSWPAWVTHEPTDIDDTAYNNLCRSCHNDVRAPYVKTHSSLTTSNQYGDGIDSNFKAGSPNPLRNYSYAWGSGTDTNDHVSHLMNYVGPFCDSDWDTGTNGPGGSNGRDTIQITT